MHTTKVEWAGYAWNPITGHLKSADGRAPYINSRRFAGDARMNRAATGKYEKDGDIYILNEKFTTSTGGTLTRPFRNDPTYFRYRLESLDQIIGSRNVLVSYGEEMFGPWVPDYVIAEIFDACAKHPRNHYLFTTGYPERYEELRKNNLLPTGDQYWYGSFAVQRYFRATGYHCFALMTANDSSGWKPDPKLEWYVIGNWKLKTSDKPQGGEWWLDRFVADCGRKGIPVFCESTLSKQKAPFPTPHEFPEILKDKIHDPEVEKKHIESCLFCGKEGRKKDMVAILARPGRNKTAYRIGYVGKECFESFCDRNNVQSEDVQKVLEEDDK